MPGPPHASAPRLELPVCEAVPAKDHLAIRGAVSFLRREREAKPCRCEHDRLADSVALSIVLCDARDGYFEKLNSIVLKSGTLFSRSLFKGDRHRHRGACTRPF